MFAKNTAGRPKKYTTADEELCMSVLLLGSATNLFRCFWEQSCLPVTFGCPATISCRILTLPEQSKDPSNHCCEKGTRRRTKLSMSVSCSPLKLLVARTLWKTEQTCKRAERPKSTLFLQRLAKLHVEVTLPSASTNTQIGKCNALKKERTQ